MKATLAILPSGTMVVVLPGGEVYELDEDRVPQKAELMREADVELLLDFGNLDDGFEGSFTLSFDPD